MRKAPVVDDWIQIETEWLQQLKLRQPDVLELLSASEGVEEVLHEDQRCNAQQQLAVTTKLDEQLQERVISIAAEPHLAVRLTTPRQPGLALELTHPFVTLQVCVPAKQQFAFDVCVHDANNDKTLLLNFSTSTRSVSVDNQHARLPLPAVCDNVWRNLTLPLAHLTSALWPWAWFHTLAKLTIYANCALRTVFTKKHANMSGHDSNYDIPPEFAFARDVRVESILLTMERLRMCGASELPELPANATSPAAGNAAYSQNTRILSGKLKPPKRYQKQQHRHSLQPLTGLATMVNGRPPSPGKLDLNKSQSLPRLTSGQSRQPSAALGSQRNARSRETIWERLSAGKSSQPQTRELTGRARYSALAWHRQPQPHQPPHPAGPRSANVLRFRRSYHNRACSQSALSQSQSHPSAIAEVPFTSDSPATTDIHDQLPHPPLPQPPPRETLVLDKDKLHTVADLVLAQRMEQLLHSSNDELIRQLSDRSDNDDTDDDEFFNGLGGTTSQRQRRPNHHQHRQQQQQHYASVSSINSTGAAHPDLVDTSSTVRPRATARPASPAPLPPAESSGAGHVAWDDEYLETAALESMRRAHNAPDGKSAKTNIMESLRRHVYEDESEVEEDYEEEDWSDSPPDEFASSSEWPSDVRKPATTGTGTEMAITALNASLSHSIMSHRLPLPAHNGRKSRSPQPAAANASKVLAVDSVDGEAGGHDDSGVDSVDLNNVTPPVMEMIFDPDLNCYFHKNSGRPYQIGIQPLK